MSSSKLQVEVEIVGSNKSGPAAQAAAQNLANQNAQKQAAAGANPWTSATGPNSRVMATGAFAGVQNVARWAQQFANATTAQRGPMLAGAANAMGGVLAGAVKTGFVAGFGALKSSAGTLKWAAGGAASGLGEGLAMFGYRNAKADEPKLSFGDMKKNPVFAGYAIGDGLRNMVGSLNDFAKGAAAATVALSGMAAMTAPAMWATFTGSIQLLSGEIVSLFIPAFIEATSLLQRGAAWIAEWDAATKGTISTIATWGAYLAFGGAIFKGLSFVISPVIAGFSLLATGAAKVGAGMIAFAVQNPLMAAGIALVAILGVITDGFGLFSNSLAGAAKKIEENTDFAERMRTGPARRADWESFAQGYQERVMAVPPEQRAGVMQTMVAEHTAEINRLQGLGNADALQTRLQGRLGGLFGSAAENTFLNMTGNVAAPATIQMRVRATVLEELRAANIPQAEIDRRMEMIPAYRRVPSGEELNGLAATVGTNSDLSRLVADRARLQNFLQYGIPGILPAGMSNPQPSRSFGSGDQFYADVLQSVVGRGELDQRNFERKMENDMAMLREIQGLRADVQRGPNPPP